MLFSDSFHRKRLPPTGLERYGSQSTYKNASYRMLKRLVWRPALSPVSVLLLSEYIPASEILTSNASLHILKWISSKIDFLLSILTTDHFRHGYSASVHIPIHTILHALLPNLANMFLRTYFITSTPKFSVFSPFFS